MSSSKKLSIKYREFLTGQDLVLRALHDIESSPPRERLGHAWLREVLIRCKEANEKVIGQSVASDQGLHRMKSRIKVGSK